MIKKSITYTDFNGEEKTEELLFNLTKLELTNMELAYEGGFSAMIQKIVDEKDVKGIVSVIQDLILTSYGEKSPDGKRFIKNDVLRNEFAQTEAYSELFMQLATDPDAATAFINGIIPKVQI